MAAFGGTPDEKPKPDLLFALNVTATFIGEKPDHTGEIAVEIKKSGKDDQKVFFRVEGAIPKPVTLHTWRMEGDTQVDAPDVVLKVIPAKRCRGPRHGCRPETDAVEGQR